MPGRGGAPLGVDDSNEGVGGCPGHEWRLVEFAAARGGAYVEQVCIHCGTVALVGPRELGGWV